MAEKISIKSFIEKKCVEKNIPFHMVIELTYKCNLSCRHCYISKGKQKELSLEEIKSILDQLVDVGTLNLIFTGGEIFTRKDFFEIADYARKRGFSLSLLTNGTLINKKEADKIKALKPDGVEISILGASPRTHDYITKCPGSFNKAVQAIRMLVKRNIQVVAKTVLMQFNVKEYKAIKSLTQDLGAISNIGLGIIAKKDGSSEPKSYELSYGDRIKHLSEGEGEINFLMEDIFPKNMLTCKAGKAVGAITPYGEVQPCILMPLVLGNLKEKSFRDIWYTNENKMLNQLRELRSSDLVTCSKCKNISFCIRCPGVAYIETNSLVAPSPTACENAKWRAYQSQIRL